MYAGFEGGVLGTVDYLAEVQGVLVPIELIAPVTSRRSRRRAEWRAHHFRRPTDADHDTVVDQIDDWAGGRTARQLVPRLWFRHFTGTSWAAPDDGRVVGIAIAFLSPDDPSVAVLHLVGVDPATGGAASARSWPRGSRATRWRAGRVGTDDRLAGRSAHDRFLEAVGFHLVEPPDGQRLFGTPAVANFDEPGDDRAELERSIDAGGR